MAFLGIGMGSGWLYTTLLLRAVQSKGIFASAEEGMVAILARTYVQPEKIQVIYAGTNSFDGSDPHVWYVIACVWGDKRADGSSVGSEKHDYDQPGLFFLDTKDGWVFVPEGAFPILLGFWMKIYGMADPGSSQPTTDWSSAPQGECIF